MKPLHSILLRLVDGLKRVVDKLVEHAAQHLRPNQTHAQPRTDRHFRGVGAIGRDAGEAKRHHASKVSVLGYGIDEERRDPVIANRAISVSYAEYLARLNDHLVRGNFALNQNTLLQDENYSPLNMQPKPPRVDGAEA